jgi:6-phosphogluconolactonase
LRGEKRFYFPMAPTHVSIVRNRFWLLLLLCVTVLSAAGTRSFSQPSAAAAGSYLVYVGTYTGRVSKGIYAYRFDPAAGTFNSLGLVGETTSPSFLAVDPGNRFLYAVNEIHNFEGKTVGGVSAFTIDAASGKLTQLNQKSSGGADPCHLVLDKAGKNVLVANYNGGSVESLAIQPDGSLGDVKTFIQHSGKSVNPQRQEAAHAHCFALDAANHLAYVCDLGMDKVMIYKFDSGSGALTANEPAFVSTKPGSGPRHIALSPDGHQAYVVSEMASTITHFTSDAKTGGLTEQETVSLLPDDYKGNSTAAEVLIHPSGKFVYGSNRGHDSIAVFAIDPATGKLSFVQREPTKGRGPRGVAIDPTGKFLLAGNQNSSSIAVFTIDAATGKLAATDNMLQAPSPVSIVFVPVK